MIDTILMNSVVMGLVDLATAVLLLASALVISSVVRMNRGAKANTAFVVISAGIIVGAVVPCLLALKEFGLTDLTKWGNLLTLVSAVLVLAGVAAWRRIIRRMIA